MWRNTALRAELLPGVDGRVSFGLLVFLVHFSWWTFGIFAGCVGIFRVISLGGYTLTTAWLRLKRMATGNMRRKWSAAEYNRRHFPGDIPVF